MITNHGIVVVVVEQHRLQQQQPSRRLYRSYIFLSVILVTNKKHITTGHVINTNLKHKAKIPNEQGDHKNKITN